MKNMLNSGNEINHEKSWLRFVNHLLNYLLTYLLTYLLWWLLRFIKICPSYWHELIYALHG